jgi:hypothetical protein
MAVILFLLVMLKVDLVVDFFSLLLPLIFFAIKIWFFVHELFSENGCLVGLQYPSDTCLLSYYAL